MKRSIARARLLEWYRASARDLPWRKTKDPYAIWVSEVMLQQTRVDTVLAYYRSFMERFPTPASLAEANEDEVMARWSGLGYYRRARLLHRGVREVVAKYGGSVPSNAKERQALPGIGRYTAGAIGSIAFGHQEPIVDGNVARVLSRYVGSSAPIDDVAARKRLWAEAEEWVKGEHPGDLNQALMELGATLCTPRNARCDRCPISFSCVAHATQQVDDIPPPRVRRPPKNKQLVALVARTENDDESVLLVRTEGALFGGLHGLPMAEGNTRKDAVELMKKHRITGSLATKADGEIEHVLTHRILRVRPYLIRNAKSSELVFWTPEAMREVGISTLTRKILAKNQSL